MTPEGKVKHLVENVLKAANVWYFMPRGTALGKAGVPDFICCVHGKFVAIETKAGGRKLSGLQKVVLDDIVFNGGVTYVVVGVAGVEKFTKDFVELYTSVLRNKRKVEEYRDEWKVQDSIKTN